MSAEDRRVQFVTLKAYQKAGGTIRRDLFSKGDAGVFIEDVALLDQLTADKLARGAAFVRKEGWQWVEVQTVFDAPKPQPKAQAVSEAGEDPAPTLSASLIEDLTIQQSAALSAELKDQPTVALAAVVHTMVLQVFYGEHGESALQISLSTPALKSAADSAAMQELEQARCQWGDRLPSQQEDLWAWCLEAPQDTLLSLMAFCAARSVNLVKMKHENAHLPRLQHGQQLARAASLDMNDWFTPLAANYFGRLSKAQIIDAMTEARNQPPAPAWLKLGKAELAERAEREIGGTGWLPEPLRLAA